MFSIIDYVKKYGDCTLEEKAFNEVDSLILSQLSYLKYDGIVPGINESKNSVVMKDVYEHEDYDKLFSDKRYEKHNRELFFAAMNSKRFGSMRMNNYISILDEEWELQFSAMTFIFDAIMFVAFRGTDENLIGWKEDFNMAFLTPIPAQEKAVQYLNIVAIDYMGTIMVGGHSKGGNLAVYASMKCMGDIKEKIVQIYSMDGPGFRPEILEADEFEKIVDRIKKLVPHSSIVGMVLSTQEPYEVVECKNFSILQHDPYNWLVNGDQFIKVTAVYRHKVIQDDSVNRWVYQLSEEELSVFGDNIYSIITASGAKTLLDFGKDPAKKSKAMMEAVDKLDDDSREMIKVIIGRLIDEMTSGVRDAVVDKIKQSSVNNVVEDIKQAKIVTAVEDLKQNKIEPALEEIKQNMIDPALEDIKQNMIAPVMEDLKHNALTQVRGGKHGAGKARKYGQGKRNKKDI